MAATIRFMMISGASTLEWREPLLAKLRADSDVSVRHFPDGVFDSAAEDDRDLGRRQAVVLLEPLRHPARRAPHRVLERAAEPYGHQVRRGLDARRRERLRPDQVDRELDLHRRFERVAVQFAVALSRVAVTDEQQ